MLKTMLSASDDLDFVDELFLLAPRWLHPDLQWNIRRHVGALSGTGALDRLMDLLYSGKPFGWFFAKGIHELDPVRLRAELSLRELNLKSIFESLMIVHAEKKEKQGLGAKFPLHYSFAGKLLEWYPDCRLIHTTRNPKATYASQVAKYTKSETSALRKRFVRLQHFIHINIQISWTARLHRELREFKNYQLVRYEDVVANPNKELRRICKFIDTEFVPGMLSPHQYGSSFDTIGSGTGVDRSSLERWRTTISPFASRIIDIAHRSAYSAFGYRNDD
jgi:hypothetical protein